MVIRVPHLVGETHGFGTLVRRTGLLFRRRDDGQELRYSRSKENAEDAEASGS